MMTPLTSFSPPLNSSHLSVWVFHLFQCQSMPRVSLPQVKIPSFFAFILDFFYHAMLQWEVSYEVLAKQILLAILLWPFLQIISLTRKIKFLLMRRLGILNLAFRADRNLLVLTRKVKFILMRKLGLQKSKENG